MLGPSIYRVSIQALFLALGCLSYFSCSHPRPGEVPIHISLANYYVDSQTISLTVNGESIYERKWKWRHNQTTQCWMPNELLTIHTQMGSHDTTFTLHPNHRPVYVAIAYSRPLHRFMVLQLDSAAYWQYGAGDNDTVEYDKEGNVMTD